MPVVRVTWDMREGVVEQLKRDLLANVFAVYDLQHDFENTEMYACLEEGEVKGYVLVYHGTAYPSVCVEGSKEAVAELVSYIPQGKLIAHVPLHLADLVLGRLPGSRVYRETWMAVRRGEACFYESRLVRRLSSGDAEQLYQLLSTREDRPPLELEDVRARLERSPTYGVFLEGRLVSYAGSFIQLPEVWMIGGVYTHPAYRNRGYATLATSAVTKEALEKAEMAALFARSDNHPAIRVYTKLGYRKMMEKLWIDAGTGLKP
ncbi:MAG: hypothetical protein DRN99_03680 [Thermoproteota archaeon]|nr:MAG: hypothetical protein DRN99_03680 [Candidatus Korarchaeota archaeon]